MTYPRRYEVEVTTSTGGSGSGYVRRLGATATGGDLLNGLVHEVYYVPATATGDRYATTADITWTGTARNEQFFKLSNTTASTIVSRAVRQATYGATGDPLLYAASGTSVASYHALANERVKIEVASGGVSKKGTLGIVVG